MSEKLNLNTLKPCDRIIVPKSNLGIVQHHVICLGKDENGERFYIENAINKGVRIINEATLFKNGYEVTRVETFNGSRKQRREALEFALRLIGKKYDLFNFNCEHYANAIQYNKIYSDQVNKGIGIALIALFLFAITTNFNNG